MDENCKALFDAELNDQRSPMCTVDHTFLNKPLIRFWLVRKYLHNRAEHCKMCGRKHALIKIEILADVSTQTLNSLSSETRQEGLSVDRFNNEFSRF